MCTRPRGQGWEGRGEDRVTTCQQPCRWPPLGCLACRYFPSAPTVCAVDVFFFFLFFPILVWWVVGITVWVGAILVFWVLYCKSDWIVFCCCLFCRGRRDCYCAVAAILEVQLANWLNFCYTFAPTPDEGRMDGGWREEGLDESSCAVFFICLLVQSPGEIQREPILVCEEINRCMLRVCVLCVLWVLWRWAGLLQWRLHHNSVLRSKPVVVVIVEWEHRVQSLVSAELVFQNYTSYPWVQGHTHTFLVSLSHTHSHT